MSDQKLLLAFFDQELTADNAVDWLKEWDKSNDEIKLGAIGILVKDEEGKIKTHKVGKRAGGKGAKTFAVLGAIAGVLSGGITIVGGVVYGAVLGGILGSFFHRGLGLSDQDLAHISSELDSGKAAVGLLVYPGQVDVVSEKLQAYGGVIKTYEVTEEAVDQALEASEAVAA